jgi:CheY-like chemotaxis protein
MDDDEAILEFITMALIDEGYEVVAAENGQAGLACIEVAQPDLIILDMRMPIMDGEGFLAAYHANRYPPVPIIALSAGNSFAQGGSDQQIEAFAKPFDLGELLQAIHNYLAPTRQC